MAEREWDGVAFDSSLVRGSSDCRLTLGRKRIVARLPSGDSLAIDLSRMEISGTPDVGFSFMSTVPGGPTFSTRSLELHAAVVAAQTASPADRRPATNLTLGLRLFWGSLIAVVAVTGLSLLLMGPLARLAVKAVPLSFDEAIGRKALEGALGPSLFGTPRVREEPELQGTVAAVVKRLTLDEADGPFDVRVLDLPMVNAFALPGGHILVTTALLELAGSPEELAGVLAHEMSHVTRRHAVELLVRRLGLRVTLMGVLGRGGSVGSALVGAAAIVTSLGFNRTMEADADAEGVRRMALAAVDPQGAVRFMERLEVSEREMRAQKEFLRTHPLTPQRIAAMRERIRRLPPLTPAAIDVDFAAMKRALGAARTRAP